MTNTPLKSSLFSNTRTVVVALAVALACSASFAEKPDKGGHGGEHGGKHEQKAYKNQNKHDKYDKDDKHNNYRDARVSSTKSEYRPRVADVRVGGYFGAPQRVVVTNYYGEQFRAGRCPPGLAKKNNGCMPPGQAKKYTVGQRLPSNVVYYAVPQTVVYQLGAPPSGHRYVRVASDILLLTIGTGMVIDAIDNLSSY